MKAPNLRKLISFLLLMITFATQAADDPPVKKSKTGICHARGSTFYEQTKHYIAFNNIDDCLKSGGRLPKR